MRTIKKEIRQCATCMNEHEVAIVEVEEAGTFKGKV